MVLGAAKRLDRHRQGNRLGIFLVVLGMVSICDRGRECQLAEPADLGHSYESGWRWPPGMWLSARPSLVLISSGVEKGMPCGAFRFVVILGAAIYPTHTVAIF
jgi:hypothetical protein